MPASDSPASKDMDFAARLSARDERVIEEIYATYSRATFGYLMQMLGNRATAEDVQQQVYLEVWKRGANYDPQRSGILTWIMQITRSRAIDHLRKRIPEPVDPHDPATESRAGHESPLEGLHDQWYIAHFLAQLPTEEAQLLRLRFADDKSQSEIAKLTGVPLGTVKMRMVSGMRRLRELIDADRRGELD